MKRFLLFVSSALIVLTACQDKMIVSPNAVSIPLKGNTYVTSGKEGAEITTHEGNAIRSWTTSDAVISTWFKTSRPGKLNLFIKARRCDDVATIQVKVCGKTFSVKVNNEIDAILPVGSVVLPDSGYVRIDVKGIYKAGEQFPLISEWFVDGEATIEPLYFVRDFEPYWGSRGPSVHMKYTQPQEHVEYFYNELLVQEGDDPIGSYFMTNGFGEGYCGLQVNSESERRILFSVWSPYTTDNPQDIPEDQRIIKLAQGKDVHVGEFGNEGSGGQSYLKYNWKSGITYKVITRVCPDGKGNTDYYAWFYVPEEKRWQLVAGFRRPNTDTWYTGAHSFLENFIPEQGYLERKVFFKNQWVRTAEGHWIELTKGTFTNDATAQASVRMDFAGGVEEESFFLKNGGFFNDYTGYKSVFARSSKNQVPEVDVEKLPLE